MNRYNHAALACYLDYIGIPIVETKWNDGVCRWAFERTSELSEAVNNFFSGQARVDPAEFFKQVTEFKRAMYDAEPLDEDEEVSS